MFLIASVLSGIFAAMETRADQLHIYMMSCGFVPSGAGHTLLDAAK